MCSVKCPQSGLNHLSLNEGGHSIDYFLLKISRRLGLNHLSLNEGGHLSEQEMAQNRRQGLNHLSLNEGGHMGWNFHSSHCE